MPDVMAQLAALPCWRGPIMPEPLTRGITNTNFKVVDRGRSYFVRIGQDIPVHGVLRSNELAACRAAEAAGISPAVVYAAPGVLVLHFIEGRTYAPADVRAELARIVALVRRAHRDMPKHLRGAALIFWVFHVIRDYVHTLAEGQARLAGELSRYLAIAARLERAVGPIELIYGHNDLLAANFLDDGRRLWLVDWDYAGFNSPLFDLGGLASNNELDDAQRMWLLEAYYERPPDDAQRHRFVAMTCASLLREALWSMVSEQHSALDFDFVAYTTENLARFERALAAFDEMDR